MQGEANGAAAVPLKDAEPAVQPTDQQAIQSADQPAVQPSQDATDVEAATLTLKDEPAPPTTKPKKRRSCPWRLIICWSMIALGIVLLAVGITILVLVSTFSITNPTVKLVGLQLSDLHLDKSGGIFDLQNFGIFISAVVNVTVAVTNPNKFSINVKAVDVGVSYADYVINNTTLTKVPSIGAYATQDISIPFNFTQVPIFRTGGTSAANAFLDIIKSSLALEFLVMVTGDATYLSISSPMYTVDVACVVTVDPRSAGILSQVCTTNVST